MRLKGFWMFGALALVALAFVGAGCGGSKTTTVTVDSSSVESTETDTTAMEEGMTTTETETTETTGTTETTETTETGQTETDAMSTDTTEASGLSSFATSENCQKFLTFASDLSSAMSGSGDTDLQDAADTLQKYADEAPEEIRSDFQALADAYSKLADAFQGVDLNSTEAPPADVLARIAAATSSIDTAALTKAGANISAWTTQNCTPGG